MTTYNKQTLQTFFQTADVPDGNDYANLIDSQVNLVETSSQAMGGALSTPELVTSRVSAGNGVFTGTVSAAAIYADTITTVTLGFTNVSAQRIWADNLTVSGAVSSNALYSNTASIVTVSAGTVYSTNGVIAGVGVVSAAGTAQGTAASLVNIVNRGKGIADGSTTGFTPLANKPGLVQYLFNEGVSANLWPPTGGTINGLAANAAFSLAASAMVTIVHLTASAYAVK